MLKHPDPEVQFLVEMLESQRDSAVAQAAANFRMAQELQAKVNELEVQANKGLDDQSDNEKIGGTD
jgi:hypothetical protein